MLKTWERQRPLTLPLGQALHWHLALSLNGNLASVREEHS